MQQVIVCPDFTCF